MKDELQPAFKVTVTLDGDDYPPAATDNVRRLLHEALDEMQDSGAIRAYILEVVRR